MNNTWIQVCPTQTSAAQVEHGKKRISDAFRFIVFWKVLLDLRSVEEGLCAESPIG